MIALKNVTHVGEITRCDFFDMHDNFIQSDSKKLTCANLNRHEKMTGHCGSLGSYVYIDNIATNRQKKE